MLPLTFPDNLQQAQTAPRTLSGDLLHLPTQLVVGALSLVRMRACVPDHCARPVRAINGDRICESDSCRLLSMFPPRNLDTLRRGAMSGQRRAR
jgi:hypothetical protein